MADIHVHGAIQPDTAERATQEQADAYRHSKSPATQAPLLALTASVSF